MIGSLRMLQATWNAVRPSRFKASNGTRSAFESSILTTSTLPVSHAQCKADPELLTDVMSAPSFNKSLQSHDNNANHVPYSI